MWNPELMDFILKDFERRRMASTRLKAVPSRFSLNLPGLVRIGYTGRIPEGSMSRRFLCFRLALLMLLAPVVVPQHVQAAAPPRIDLSGKWVSDEGATLEITHVGNTVLATFIQGSECPHGDSRSYYLDGKLIGDQLSGPFMACGMIKDLIDCGAPKVYETTFTATVKNSDEISGKRIAQGWYAQRSGGRLTNCHEDSDYSKEINFRLTRECDQVEGRCEALQAARAALGRLIQGYQGHDPSSQDWQNIVNENKQQIIEGLQTARRKMCNDAAAQSVIDGFVHEFESMNPSSPSNGSEILQQARRFASADLALQGFQQQYCGSSGTGRRLRTCGNGTEEIDPPTNEALDQVVGGIEDSIKQLLEEAGEFDRASEQGSAIWGKIDKLQKMKGFWEQIKAASCLPPEVAQGLRSYVNERKNRMDTSDECNTLCSDTADWIASMTGNQADQYFSMESCLAACN